MRVESRYVISLRFYFLSMVRLDAQAVWRDELARVKFPSPFLFVLSACGIEECSVCRCR
ncbi:hypothetical protein COLO4_09208 [Corchorus olitorius]|uniref:Uncharacterized protein n=1 Tax=Corchorus olitorius TaxID=93759 RepID=A0A1R3KCT5_9ROSI|nr:hypothetical protein COLO4_09208 [Corchorus olitorius]